MIEWIIYYFVVGLFISTAWSILLNYSRWYKPTTMSFIIGVVIWPYILIGFLFNLIFR